MIPYLLIALTVIIVDQLVKIWTVNQIVIGETVLHNPVLSLTHLHNEGAAWSMLEGKMWFFYIVTVVCCLVIGYLLVHNIKESKWLTVGLALILGGAIGNFIDRIRLGYVVDMFQVEFFNFPIFNVADTALSIGVACVLIYILLDEKKE
ncbi:signal peptidase II [Vagococcus coleopterorum]|uniref:Lipoprotein signal peptidase n=1 Tax=Vagococcus coleopterorum TaxID=2714946 RepID=A0A6G8AN37_9ENTE|nr:signal peptidase II [Vagococcus coleopterorum]QIL46494.1 signal peptidase II [Vagococcus coleopterorum]